MIARYCPTCGQPITLDGLPLPPIKRRIYDLVRKHPGLNARELHDLVWATDRNGGPGPRGLYVHIAHLNKMLRGAVVRSGGRGYRVYYAEAAE